MFWSAKFIFASEPSRSAFASRLSFLLWLFENFLAISVINVHNILTLIGWEISFAKSFMRWIKFSNLKLCLETFFPYFLYNNNSKPVSKKFKHAFWLMMKNKEMRKENVLLWPLFCAYFFCFPFCRKTHAWIPRKYDVLSNCFKMKQLQLSLEEKSTFFAAPEVMTEFSAAWCLSFVSQGAKVYSY